MPEVRGDEPVKSASPPPETEGAFPEQDLREQPLKDAVALLEKYRLVSALESARFNQKSAARNLGLTYDQFRGLKKKHHL